jgi:hypothetical protein
MTADELRRLLRDADAPFAFSATSVPSALRSGSPPERTRVVRLRDLAAFAESRCAAPVDIDELAALLVEELGARRLPHADLDDAPRRALRRIVGKRGPRQDAYELPESV